jgi:hypothetical protein
MNHILADRKLVDLIEQLEKARSVIEAFGRGRMRSDPLHAAAAAVNAAVDYLLQLREAQHAAQTGQAFSELRDNVARRAARIRRQTRATGETAHGR